MKSIKKNILLLVIFLVLLVMAGFAQKDALTDIHKGNSYSARPDPVSSNRNPILPLNGSWHFDPNPGVEMSKIKPRDGSRWAEIKVPGDWTNQNFKVKPGEPGNYYRTFEIPDNWKGQRIKLRADGIQSWCRVWVNNKYAGSHLGGFTAFEIDITDQVKTGQNKLFISVQNESIADSLASTTQYAAFQIGGIFRKIYLMAVPEISFSDLKIEAGLDDTFNKGILKIAYNIQNQGKPNLTNLEVKYFLTDKNGESKTCKLDNCKLNLIISGEKSSVVTESGPLNVEKWDCEHPNLYQLTLQLFSNGKLIESVSRKIGFRSIEVIGNQVFVNGMPVKLHGSNRHETHPLTGRTLTPQICLQDVLLFRDANVNYVRTSHYPPSEEFLDACDSLGMFVEVESPFCWVGHSANSKWDKENPASLSFEDYILQATSENMRFNFNHPSILIWSLANESQWSSTWHDVHKLSDSLDDTRPKTFHDQAFGGYNNFGSTEMQIANYHYPGDADPFLNRESTRPLLFGEYCHINTYNRREILTDPGVRDNWGQGFSRMWEQCYLSKSVLGAAIWAGIDDIFYLPDSTAVGYGEWGIIDGWRRPKPEYFHVKKAYSPVKIFNSILDYPGENGRIRLNVENRNDFSNFNELDFQWKAGESGGKINTALAPRTEGFLTIETGKLAGNEQYLEIIINSPRGFEIDHYKIPFNKTAPKISSLPVSNDNKLTISDDGTYTVIKSDKFTYTFRNKSGQLISAYAGKREILSSAPEMMVLAQATEECRPKHNLYIKTLNDVLSAWQCDGFECKMKDDTITAITKGRYKEAEGVIKQIFTTDGAVLFEYEFQIKNDLNPRQFGMVFYLPVEFQILNWERKGIWTGYPEDHIGREKGSAALSPGNAKKSIWDQPAYSWKDDFKPLGNSDFCSTKSNIIRASITSLDGSGLSIQSDGNHSIRAFSEGGKTGFLIADFNTGGGDMFFAGHHKTEDKPLKAGESIKGKFTIKLN